MRVQSMELLRALPAKPRTPPGLPLVARNWGVVTAIQYGPPLTVTITLGGSSVAVPNVPCLNSYVPKVGDMVMVDHGDSVPTVVGSVQGAAQPLGMLAHQRITANSGTIGNTITALGLSRTVTIGASRVISIRARTRMSSSTAGDVMTVYVLRDGNIIEAHDCTQRAGAAEPQNVEASDEGAPAGSHTYSISAVIDTPGHTGNNQASATKASWLRIRDEGPV